MRIDRKRFDLALARAGWTMAEAAERSGLSRQRLSDLLRQERVSPRTLWKVAVGLGVDVEELISEEEG